MQKLQNVIKNALNEELGLKEETQVNRSDIVICPNIPDTNGIGHKWKIFLAGPIQGAPEWQFEVPQIKDVIYFSPRRKTKDGFDYKQQVEWERDYLNVADIILMWVPEESDHVEGRSYAQTTRTEFGEYIAKGKKIIFGCYKDFPGMRYFKTKLKEFGQDDTVYNSLSECVDAAESYIEDCVKNKTTYFTSDTHFSDERAWKLSRRPFISVDEMDMTLIRNWNKKVKPCDTIYHLGDFGKDENKMLRFLNGTKILIYGNYERDGKYTVNKKLFDKIFKNSVIVTINRKKYCLCHEPSRGKSVSKKHPDLWGTVFGHIHGRDKVKKFNATDAGVDANFFYPMSVEDADFFINAVHKGYYDEEVWLN